MTHRKKGWEMNKTFAMQQSSVCCENNFNPYYILSTISLIFTTGKCWDRLRSDCNLQKMKNWNGGRSLAFSTEGFCPWITEIFKVQTSHLSWRSRVGTCLMKMYWNTYETGKRLSRCCSGIRSHAKRKSCSDVFLQPSVKTQTTL